jgi:hypothetical protein
MTQTLASAVLATARMLTNVLESSATSGSATTLIDGNYPGRSNVVPEDDWYNGGTVHHLSGSRSGSSIVTDWVKSSKTFTFATGTAVVATNRYAAYNADYPRDVLRAKVNSALEGMPSIPQVDATLITVADQEAYTLPSGVYDVREIAVENDGANLIYYVDERRWRERNGKIYFDAGYYPDLKWGDGQTIRLWYYAKHAELTSDSSTISDYIATEWLQLEAAIRALEWRIRLDRGEDGDVAFMYNQFKKDLKMVRAEHRNKIPRLSIRTRLADY